MKMKFPFFISLVAFLFFSWKFIQEKTAIPKTDSPSLEIRLRDIGHQLLQKAGDSTSRVLPVKKLSKEKFTIQFENNLFIEPDTLVKIVKANMNAFNFSESYIVEVAGCKAKEVVYGFEIYQESSKDIVPCLGRSLPSQCYEITISFSQQKFPVSSFVFLLLSSVVCISFGLIIFKQQKNTQLPDTNEQFIPLGKIHFNPEKQLLKSETNTIELTAKENHVLKILASNTNEILSREQLQKEVWEDEGVLVGRSLDVFISKLRKKLEADPAIRIVNIHGKGYKLEV